MNDRSSIYVCLLNSEISMYLTEIPELTACIVR